MVENMAPGPAGRMLDHRRLTAADRRRLKQQFGRALRRASPGRSGATSLHFGGEARSEADAVTVTLPEDLSHVIAQALAEVVAGRCVHVAAEDEELTIQEAAGLLGVSRPYLVGLLEEGEIPLRKEGIRRRVHFGDALASPPRAGHRRIRC